MKPGHLLRGDTARYAGVGLQFAGTFLVFGLGGYYLDQWLGSEPWLMIICIFLGATGGFIHLVYTVQAPLRHRKQRKQSERGTGVASNDTSKRSSED